jgi:hypothetical protein
LKKVPRQAPLVLLVKLEWKEGKLWGLKKRAGSEVPGICTGGKKLSFRAELQFRGPALWRNLDLCEGGGLHFDENFDVEVGEGCMGRVGDVCIFIPFCYQR